MCTTLSCVETHLGMQDERKERKVLASRQGTLSPWCETKRAIGATAACIVKEILEAMSPEVRIEFAVNQGCRLL